MLNFPFFVIFQAEGPFDGQDPGVQKLATVSFLLFLNGLFD